MKVFSYTAISTMTERESAHPPPQRLEPSDPTDASDQSDATDPTGAADTSEAARGADGDSREPRDRLLPQRAGPDGEDREDHEDTEHGDCEKRTVAHVSPLFYVMPWCRWAAVIAIPSGDPSAHYRSYHLNKKTMTCSY